MALVRRHQDQDELAIVVLRKVVTKTFKRRPNGLDSLLVLETIKTVLVVCDLFMI